MIKKLIKTVIYLLNSIYIKIIAIYKKLIIIIYDSDFLITFLNFLNIKSKLIRK